MHFQGAAVNTLHYPQWHHMVELVNVEMVHFGFTLDINPLRVINVTCNTLKSYSTFFFSFTMACPRRVEL